jgi:hypothetical protein
MALSTALCLRITGIQSQGIRIEVFYEPVNVKTTAAGVAQSVSLTSLTAARPRFQKDGQDMQHRLGK